MPLKTHMDDQPSLNLTPMIDIVFLLIIFFMVGTKFAEMEQSIVVELPRVKNVGPLTAPPSKRIVTLQADGSVSLDQTPVTLDQLVSELRSAVQGYAETSVLVRGDSGGSLQNLATVLTACREAGIQDMGINVRADKSIH
ncbi:MAG: biopolymer transporter ExbD [Planctomycetales bacterium]|nr:biopolymer transporter ExbD [Planctomycetales bacterium]